MLIAPFLFATFLSLGDPPVSWEFRSVVAANNEVVIGLTAHIESGWHIYATKLPSDEGPLPTVITITESEQAIVGELLEPEPVEQFDPNFAILVKHHSGDPEFQLKLTRRTREAFTVKGEVEYMACNDRTCLPPVAVPFTIEIAAISPQE